MSATLKDASSGASNDIGSLAPIVLGSQQHMSQENMKSDTQQDLRNARALLEQIGNDDEKRKYQKAAEIILIKATRLDPENDEAKILLQSVRGVPAPPPSALLQPRQPQQLPQSDDPPLFTNLGSEKKKSWSKILFGLIAILAIGAGIIWMHGMSSSSAASPPVTRTPNVQQKAIPAAPAPDAPAASAAEEAAPFPKAPTGKLAVASSPPGEIYQGDKRLGLTPTTLQLPVGKQTLEYRLGDLRTVVSHDIKADRTTSATVTFQTT